MRSRTSPPLQAAALAAIDWFIPGSLSAGRSELGLARNFVVGQFISSSLLLPIAVVLYRLDPTPGAALWIIWGCILACLLMPFGLKITENFRLVAFASVELLCSAALIGASAYGGITSPFAPWLIVSLMLGFFYLSDHGFLVLMLFAGNIAATIAARFIHPTQLHLSSTDLVGVAWFSIFSATAFMSHMAIYYSSILDLSSEIERETERHRKTAQELRDAKTVADTVNAGREIFLAKMNQQLRAPIGAIVSDSAVLLDGDTGAVAPGAEIRKIHAAGVQLFAMVADALDDDRIHARPAD